MANITHKITLSTTRDNYDVGAIKVRRTDDETQIFDVEIIEDGKIKPFDGLTPFFCLMAREITGQGVSEEPVKTFDASKGTLKHTLSANAFQMVGRNEAYFSFRKELSTGEWVEQYSTRSFYYTVEKSIYTEPFKDSNYWFTFKELYRLFNQYMEDGKASWEDFFKNGEDAWQDFVDFNREIIESIDPSGETLVKLYDLISQSEKNANYIARTGFFKYLQDKTPLIAGHRGNFYLAPENTIPSFILGARDFDLIECDVSVTSDGKWVIMHDDTVDRMTNGTGAVSSLTYEQFMSLTIDAGNKIEQFPDLKTCDLEDFLRVMKEYNCKGMIEIKNGTYTDLQFIDLLNSVYKYGLGDRVIIIARQITFLQKFREMDMSISLMLVASSFSEKWLNECEKIGVGLDYSKVAITDEVVAQVRAKKLPLAVWTIEDHVELEKYRKIGIDVLASNSVL
ncbi:glycerophosphodiester phosphodiesterase family protein [Enterococcus thailandicus]|uniref:glycerophosphodiester phosphodiesterase family protein n=1 Tax=Enterococcus thailandicus TaxID=417368 RepID=UPI0039A60149